MPREGVTSVYLDPDSIKKLEELVTATGQSRSLVIRNLIQGAGSKNRVKLRRLVSQLSELVDAT